MNWRALSIAVLVGLVLAGSAQLRATPPGQYRLQLQPAMLSWSVEGADFAPLVDEQQDLGDPPTGQPESHPQLPGRAEQYPAECVVDLGAELPLATLWFFDTFNVGDLTVQTGSPGAWGEPKTLRTDGWQGWRSIALDTASRYVRLEWQDAAAIVAEIALDVWSAAGWTAETERQAAAAAAEAERQAILAAAREEALRRPIIELEPFGRLSLVDEVDCAGDGAAHQFRHAPEGTSEVTTILGREARVVTPLPGAANYISYRLGANKLLRPGGAYVVVVDYPEDVSRSAVVINTGNETALGFSTGLAVGDALHAKYVDSLCESLDLPLSGEWRQWTHYFRLHDRFPTLGLRRGAPPRDLTAEDGFDLTIGTFGAEQDPFSEGPAVARIALYEVIDADQLAQPLATLPEGVPHRRVFWREEMADGTIEGAEEGNRGLVNVIDWYRNKADLMRFLGFNTYSKDLLEFGACQHWDSALHGGNAWVHHDGRMKGLWAEIVGVMSAAGFEILPYYEYAGSRGDDSLGYQRRAKPLTRDDAYTHIGWIENANADVTDPETLVDFVKMLDCTVFAFQDEAKFAGVWLRPRSQLPVGFGDTTRARFAAEANDGTAVTREQLQADAALYDRYLRWWEGKRQEFLVGVRDALAARGLSDAFVLWTGEPGEPGVSMEGWEPRLITDRPDLWTPLLTAPPHKPQGRDYVINTPTEVAEQGLYLAGLTATGKNWGDWEVHHARPADDPQNYQATPGVMMSHAFNRLYTVSDPRTMDLFRSPAGLTLVRHNALNEHMMNDAADAELLDYFVCDFELAGPYCMLAEAVAVANGDPTNLGYLRGINYGRGFPQYVRDFNANFLALPALPSERLAGAADDTEVIVRQIATADHGTWLAVVNTSLHPAAGVRVTLPAGGAVTEAVSGEPVAVTDGTVSLDLRPAQLLTLRIATQ